MEGQSGILRWYFQLVSHWPHCLPPQTSAAFIAHPQKPGKAGLLLGITSLLLEMAAFNLSQGLRSLVWHPRNDRNVSSSRTQDHSWPGAPSLLRGRDGDGQGRLASRCPWRHRESDTTERLNGSSSWLWHNSKVLMVWWCSDAQEPCSGDFCSRNQLQNHPHGLPLKL